MIIVAQVKVKSNSSYFQQYFSYIMAVSFNCGGNRNTRRKPPTCRKSLTNVYNTDRRGFAPGFVNCEKGCTRLAAESDKAYQLLAHGRWFSPGSPASSTTKTGRHDIAEILLKVAISTINQIKSNH
jgi:hypothetical protein